MGLGCQQHWKAAISFFVGYIPKAQSIMARSTQDHIHTCLENYLWGTICLGLPDEHHPIFKNYPTSL
jgi:hypothetical protein